MSLDALGQSVSDRFQVARLLGRDADQAGLSGLACQSLVGDRISGAVPDRGAEGRIVGEPVDIALSQTTHSHGKDTFTNQFINAVTDPIGVPGVTSVPGDRIEQAESMFDIAKQNDSGMGGDSMIGRLNLEGAIELGLEKVTLVFTHRVNPCCVCVGCG